MKYIALVCILSLSAIAYGEEYRTFTNLGGETIQARILQYDSKEERVLLMLKNRKKAWIEIGSLSLEDQIYVKNVNRKRPVDSDDDKKISSEKKKEPILSKKEIKDIGKQFIKAVSKEDYETWFSMLSDMHGDTRYKKAYVQRRACRGDVSIGDIDEDNLCIELNIVRPYDSETRWLFLLPDGKIKYDALVSQHPLEEAVCMMRKLYNADMLSPQAAKRIRILPPKVRDKSVEQVIEWIIETDGNWDNSKPQCRYPPAGFKNLTQELKGYK